MIEKKAPLFSIIVPLFNREKLIRETLESIMAQTFQNWECIIVDDHSEDKSYAVVKQFASNDSRIKGYMRPGKMKKGANSCRNYGLREAKAKFIYWLDSDDVTHPNLLEYSFRCLNESNYDYVRFNRKLFSGVFEKNLIKIDDLQGDGELQTSPELIEAMLLNELEFNTCNIVWRKTSLYGESFCEDIVYADEWEFYSRILMLGLKGVNLKNVLIYGRKHKDSTTAEFRLKDPDRLNSLVTAAQMVLKNLIKNNIFPHKLKKFFLRMGFELQSYSIIKLSLNAANAGIWEKLKYRIGYKIYPILKPIFYLKAKMIKN